MKLEPIGESIECETGETVLDAAFRQGYSLAHGCREGQCSACKCYVLEGDVELKPYSNFALSDTERSGGYALMCRAMPTADAVVELLHYDPDNYRLENAIREGVGVVESITPLTERHRRADAAAGRRRRFRMAARAVRRRARARAPTARAGRSRRQPARVAHRRVDDQALSGRALLGMLGGPAPRAE